MGTCSQSVIRGGAISRIHLEIVALPASSLDLPIRVASNAGADGVQHIELATELIVRGSTGPVRPI
jgi:hypothetical protein